MEPPFFSTSCLQTQSPRPVPTVPLVVKKGSKIFFIVVSAMPLPQSATAIRTRRVPSFGSMEAEARSTILPSWPIASRLFASRFANTCRNSPAIPITRSVSSHCCSTLAPLALIFACNRWTTEPIKPHAELHSWLRETHDRIPESAERYGRFASAPHLRYPDTRELPREHSGPFPGDTACSLSPRADC
jgi:hypothetical protein